jgi:hypothetical protein
MHGRKRQTEQEQETDEQVKQRIAKIEKYKQLSSHLLLQVSFSFLSF